MRCYPEPSILACCQCSPRRCRHAACRACRRLSSWQGPAVATRLAAIVMWLAGRPVKCWCKPAAPWAATRPGAPAATITAACVCGNRCAGEGGRGGTTGVLQAKSFLAERDQQRAGAQACCAKQLWGHWSSSRQQQRCLIIILAVARRICIGAPAVDIAALQVPRHYLPVDTCRCRAECVGPQHAPAIRRRSMTHEG